MNEQFDIEFGKKLRDEGIERAINHADRKISQWQEIAYEHFLLWLRKMPRGERFMIEDFRKHMGTHLVEPPSLRAYGALAVRGAKDGVIENVGYGKVSNSKAHRTPAAIWQRL